MNYKGFIGPLIVGVLSGPAAWFVGWWALLIFLGYTVGYWDRIPLMKRETP